MTPFALLLVLALQQPEPDDVLVLFPDPPPADRMWEMAAEYYRRVGEAIWKKDLKAVEHWEQRARPRLTAPYRDALFEVVNEVSRNARGGFDEPWGIQTRLQAGLYLGFWSLKEILDSPPPPHNPGQDHHRMGNLLRMAARLESARGDYDLALKAVQEMETIGNSEDWTKIAAGLRGKILELKGCNNDPAVLPKLADFWPHYRGHSMTLAFSYLKRLKDGPAAPRSLRRVAGLKGMAALLHGVQDKAGAAAVEDRLFSEPNATPDDLAAIVWSRSGGSVGHSHLQGYLEISPERFQAAEEGCRRILREWPTAKIRKTVLESLGDLLIVGNRPAEARRSFQKLLAEEAETQGEVASGRVLRPEVHIKIGRTYEMEDSWEKALESYTEASKPGVGFIGGCGTCVDDMKKASETRVARCLVRLGRHGDVIKTFRTYLSEGDSLSGPSPELCLLAIDAAIRSGAFEEVRRDIEALAPPKHGGDPLKGAKDYIRLLELHREGDFEGLYAWFSKAPPRSDWHQNRWAPRPIYVEALECLAALGDPALNFLLGKAGQKENSDLAMIAMAHFRNERSLEFIRGDAWKVRYDQPQFRAMLEKIHAGKPRPRAYLTSAKK